MKNLLPTLLLMCVLVAQNGSAQEPPPHVSVVGVAMIDVVPDEMHWTLNVFTRGPEVSGVAQSHDRKVAGVIAFLKERSIDEKKIQTSRISLSENWVYQERERVKDGYTASTTVSFESGDMDQYRDLWMGLAGLPDININGVQFDTSKRTDLQKSTRVRAVLDAREKATALAGALDARLGDPLMISEDYSGPDQPGPMMMRGAVAFEAAAPDGPSVSPGTISITSRVSVKFLLRP